MKKRILCLTLALIISGAQVVSVSATREDEAALQQEIWAALYIYLSFRMLKENASREERYQNMIDRLSSNIENGIENIQNRLDAMEKRHASG